MFVSLSTAIAGIDKESNDFPIFKLLAAILKQALPKIPTSTHSYSSNYAVTLLDVAKCLKI